MNTSPLMTPEDARRIFSFDAESGILYWAERTSHGVQVGDQAGTPTKNGYRQVLFKRRAYLVHRVIWLYLHGSWPAGDIDHINGCRTDNREANLRDVSRRTNIENQKTAPKGKKSGAPLGVHWDKRLKKWRSTIVVKGKSKYLGIYQDPNEAHQAYLTAKRIDHAGCTI